MSFNLAFSGRNAQQDVDAFSRSQAIIWFAPDGTILDANANFCQCLGYDLKSVKGRHHSIFVDEATRFSAEYKAFWDRLGKGEFDRGEYKRIRRDGKEIWISASYNPVIRNGKVVRVVKIASDITALKLQADDDANKLTALRRSQAVIEFSRDGMVLTANQVFLDALGYKLDEIVGKHHSLFCEAETAKSQQYREFWERLRAGELIRDNFTRMAKGGRKVWIAAAYNPVFNDKGEVYKVVKFATDISRQMSSIAEVGHAIRELADGDLTSHIAHPLDVSIEQTRLDFNAAVARLRDVMKTIIGTASSTTENARQLRDATNSIARQTEQQAAALEETAAALEEITTTVSETSMRAIQAGDLIGEARRAAHGSTQIVQNAMSAMAEIEQSSSKIGQIIGVIDSIAFQTNLLALNAGVEAARAGEAGKGFAVVAQEVRELAQRSAKSAKEIGSLIGASALQVSSGVALVREAGATVGTIDDQVSRLEQHLNAMAEATREQSTALKEINAAVNLLDQGTQKNAASVEEASAASDGVAREAAELLSLLMKFKTADGEMRREERYRKRAG